jgi:RNA polymerase sigma-70 factor (ECF subfamily)
MERLAPGDTTVSLPAPVAEASDHSLLLRLRGGEQDAATALYLRYARRLQALVRARCSPQVARRVEPDDLVQSIFRRFFRRVLQGDYDVPEGQELWGLLLTIALNRVRAEESFQRAARRDVHLSAELGEDEPPALISEDTAFAALRLTLAEALARLPAHARAMLELRIQGHEIAEIAQRTARSKRTVERVLQEVRGSLRRLLVDAEGAPDQP